MYSPFTDKNGNFKTFRNIRYSDLAILEDIDEGYKIEYKSVWDKNFTHKHLSKSISSFANTDGGWLFVGINNDGTINPIDKARTDYGQQIGEIIKSHISPRPKFDTKFIKLPDNKRKGILIVRVYEGLEPPYICDGTIYTRVGSCKEPVKISQRTDIDQLYSKRKNYLDVFETFCTNKIYEDADFPYCSIYLYNQSENTPYFSDLKEDDNFINNFAKVCGFSTWMPSSYLSYIFYNSKNIGRNCYTTSLEFFRNWHIKLHLPLCTVPQGMVTKITDKVFKKEASFDITSFTAIDGYLTCEIITFTLNKVLEELIVNGCNLKDYKIKIELSNIQNSYLFFPTKNKEWLNMVCNRFRFSAKKKVITDLPYTITNPKKDNLLNSFLIVSPSIGNAFGYTSNEFNKLYASSNIVRAELLEKNNFSNHEYNDKLEFFFDDYI